MNLTTRVENNVVVFELNGNVDFESIMQFKETIATIERSDPGRIVFNLSNLRFVGSSAINLFIKVLRNLNSKPIKPRYCNLSSEFEKLFRAYQIARKPFEKYPSEYEAKASFDMPILQKRRGRRSVSN